MTCDPAIEDILLRVGNGARTGRRDEAALRRHIRQLQQQLADAQDKARRAELAQVKEAQAA